MKQLILTLVCWSLASVASAGWVPCPGSTADAGTASVVAKQRDHRGLCLRQATATDPARMDARACLGGVAITFQDVTASDYTASVVVYECAGDGAVGEFADCRTVPVDRTGDGMDDGLPLTGETATLQYGLWDLAPDWYAFNLSNAGSRLVELKVICQ